MRGRAPAVPAVMVALVTVAAMPGIQGRLEAQEIRGQVVDAENGEPVGLAGVFILSPERDVLASALADVRGFYTIDAPGAGEYYLVVQRLGYFENETPLVAVAEEGSYGVDFELRPEPIRLDPLEVSVSNERLEQYLSMEIGENPNGIFGYRVLQGLPLEEAKFGARDNTEFLRRLYIPVSWGIRVCVGWGSAASARPGYNTPRGTSDGASGRNAERSGPNRSMPCGSLYLDGYRCQAEHMEKIELDRIAVVVTLQGDVHLYTRDFEWNFRREPETIVC